MQAVIPTCLTAFTLYLTCHTSTSYSAIHSFAAHTFSPSHTRVIQLCCWDIMVGSFIKVPNPHHHHIVFLSTIWLMQLQDGRNNEVSSVMSCFKRWPAAVWLIFWSMMNTPNTVLNCPESFSLTGFAITNNEIEFFWACGCSWCPSWPQLVFPALYILNFSQSILPPDAFWREWEGCTRDPLFILHTFSSCALTVIPRRLSIPAAVHDSTKHYGVPQSVPFLHKRL